MDVDGTVVGWRWDRVWWSGNAEIMEASGARFSLTFGDLEGVAVGGEARVAGVGVKDAASGCVVQ